MPQTRRTCSITSGLSGSPAATSSRVRTGQRARSSWISIRHTVGGAQNVVTSQRTIWSRSPVASNLAWFTISTVASAFQGAYTLLHACLAQPGEESFGCAVVPDVKYRSSGSSARVGPSGANSAGAASAAP
jgi:hypothetical protein